MNKSELEKEVSRHRLRNAELLDSLAKHGLSEQDDILAEYHFWVDEQEDAISLVTELIKMGFTVMEISPFDENDEIIWNVEVRKSDQIAIVIGDNRIKELVVLAGTFGSKFDGWGTRI